MTSIGSWAYYDCSALTSVTIPNSVTSIGTAAFYDCPIETATIPAFACEYFTYTDVYNGSSSRFNRKLKTVVITSGDTISANVFSNCISLEKVYFPGAAEEWANVHVNGSRVYYYSAEAPTAKGNYWHYDDNGNVVEW